MRLQEGREAVYQLPLAGGPDAKGMECKRMIVVKKINGQEIIVNCDLIEMIEFSPHAVMSLTTGEKIIVDETRDDILAKSCSLRRAHRLLSGHHA